MAPTISLATYNAAEPAKRFPAVSVDAFGAIGDGVADDTAAMTAAVASLGAGGTVTFTSGKTYRKTGLVTVSGASVTA